MQPNNLTLVVRYFNTLEVGFRMHYQRLVCFCQDPQTDSKLSVTIRIFTYHCSSGIFKLRALHLLLPSSIALASSIDTLHLPPIFLYYLSMISYCYSFLEFCSASGHSRLHCTRIISACHKPDSDNFLHSITGPRFHSGRAFCSG